MSDVKDQPPARDPEAVNNLTLPPNEPTTPKPTDPAKNPNIPPPPPNVNLGAFSKLGEADPLLDPKNKKADDLTKPAGPAGKGAEKKKPNLFDDIKSKLMGTNKQADKVKENQGLEEFDFTYKFQKALFNQPMEQFRNYLLDEVPVAEQTSKPTFQESPVEIGPQLPPMGDKPKPENSGDKPLDNPSSVEKPSNADAAVPGQVPNADNKPSGLQAPSKPVAPIADRIKLPRFFRRIDLNFQMRTDDSYLSGVNNIITSPDGNYAIVNCDYYQSFLLVNLKQPGDRHLGKKGTWEFAEHLKWAQGSNNLYLPTLTEDMIPLSEYNPEFFKLKGPASVLQNRRSHALFFPDSSKIVVLESDRLRIKIYDTKEVSKSGWKGEKSLIQEIKLLDIDQVRRHGKNPSTGDIFGLDPDSIDSYDEDAHSRRFVTITFFYFEKLSAKGGYFESIEQDTLMIGTFYGYIRIVFPKAGFFTNHSGNKETEEQPEEEPEDKLEKESSKPVDKKKPEPNPDRWLNFLERCVQCFAPDYLAEMHDYLAGEEYNPSFFNNNSGSYGWVLKDGNVKMITSMQIEWKHFASNPKYGKQEYKKKNKNLLLTVNKTIRLGPSSSVFCESACPGDLGLLTYDNKKYEISKITTKGQELVFRIGKKTSVKTVLAKDDCKVLLIIDENGKANFYMNFNKSYILLDSFDMKLEQFQGKKDEVVGMSHYYGNVSITDDYSSVVFANNSSLFVYDLEIPAPAQRYFLETRDGEARAYTVNGPNWFLFKGSDAILARTPDDQSVNSQEHFNFTRIIDFNDRIKCKALPTNFDFDDYYERNRLRTEMRNRIDQCRNDREEQLEEDEKQDSHSQKDSEENHEVKPQTQQPKKQLKHPKPSKHTFIDKMVFDQEMLVPVRMGDKPDPRRDNSDKTIGNEFGVRLGLESGETNTQFVPGFPHLELVFWEQAMFRRCVVISLRDYSTCRPQMADGSFSPPTTKWELFFDQGSSMGAFNWDDEEKGAYFKFDPCVKLGAFQMKHAAKQRSYTYVFEISTGKIVTCLPAEIFSHVVSETEVVLAVQDFDRDDYSEPALIEFLGEFLQPKLMKYILDNRKKKPVFLYNFVKDQIVDLWTIKDYTQQPIETGQQAPYMFYNSQLLQVRFMPKEVKDAQGNIQYVSYLSRSALLVKSNLICLFDYLDMASQKPPGIQDPNQIWPVRKIQKLWDDSSKKINLNAQIRDGSVVFSPGNLWIAYYDESTMDAIRVLWTPSLDFAKFVNSKGVETDLLRYSLRGIRTLRMTFSDDNKYLVIKAGKKITLYELKPPEAKVPISNKKKDNHHLEGQPGKPFEINDLEIGWHAKPGKVLEISDLEISELASNSNIVSMKFRSGYLDIAYVRDWNFFFESIPFDFNPKHLYLKSVRNRLLSYQNATGLKDRQRAAQELAAIMMEQPIHQKFSDSTYFKILCAFKRTTPLREYLNQLVRVPHVIFKHSPYKEAVEYTNSNGTTNRVIECLIDFVQKCVDKNNELPIYDTDVLLGWLRQKEIEDNEQPEMKDGQAVRRPDVPIKISIQYKRKLLELITLAPTQRTILGELRDNQMNVAQVTSAYSEKEKFPMAIENAKKNLMDENSANSVDFNSFFTAFPFDLNNGSRFSLDYFAWLEDVSDEDLVTKYAGVIYYKWSLVLKPAVVYSTLFWLLTAALCAFMGFSYKTVWLGAIIIVLHCMFILYEFKCYMFAFIESIKDPWNYVDIVAHLFSLLSVGMLINFRNEIDNDPKLFSQLSWLRMVSFTFITFRGLGLFRIFSGTRYLIVMIFAVFKEIAIFLSVFGYMIFIYWFVCLIRPSLVPGGEDESFYNAITQSLDIAFSNFSGAELSWIVMITTVLGQVILGLVLLNYLIAIVSKTHEKVSEQRSLYDIRILLTIIKEFDSFFYIKKNDKESIDPATSHTYITVIPQKEQNIEVNKLKEGLRVAEAEQGNSKLLNDLEIVKSKVQKSLYDLEKKIEVMGSKLDIEVRQALRKRKTKQAKVMKEVPSVMKTCMESILSEVQKVKIDAQQKGEQSAAERLALQRKKEEAEIAARESQKKLEEASKDASRMIEDSSDEEEPDSMEQIDEDPDEENADEEHQDGEIGEKDDDHHNKPGN